MQSKGGIDKKKRLEARQLERQCLLKQLSRIFRKINTYAAPDIAIGNGTQSLIVSTERPVTPVRGVSALSRTPLSSVLTTPYANASSVPTVGTPRNRTVVQTSTTNSAATIDITEAPGWVSISDQLDGFDRNACAALTTQAELLELEAHSLRAAFETAQEHVNTMRQNNLSEDIIALLNTTKVAEFKAVYESVVQSKEAHIASWNAYTDTQEHIIRRQVVRSTSSRSC